jgi:hypothetical protein
MSNNSTVWENQYFIEKTKHVKALGSDFIIFSRAEDTVSNKDAKRGLYFAKIDFQDLEDNPQKKLTDFINDNFQQIVEFENNISLDQNWDVKGSSKILAVAFTLDTSSQDANSPKYTTRLMALTNNSTTFNICDEFNHENNIVSVEVIIPFEDKERAHAIYGSNGLFYSKH